MALIGIVQSYNIDILMNTNEEGLLPWIVEKTFNLLLIFIITIQSMIVVL